jgi:hypothetical protein
LLNHTNHEEIGEKHMEQTHEMVVRELDGIKSLASIGNFNQANNQLIEAAEKFGDEAVSDVIMSQPASAFAPMIANGDGNDIPVVLGFMSPLQWVQTILMAIFNMGRGEGENWEYKTQQAIIDLINQVLHSDFDDFKKREFLDELFAHDGGNLVLAAIICNAYELGHEPQYERENNPFTIEEKLKELGYGDRIKEVREHFAMVLEATEVPVKLEAIISEISDIVREMTGQSEKSGVRKNIFGSR